MPKKTAFDYSTKCLKNIEASNSSLPFFFSVDTSVYRMVQTYLPVDNCLLLKIVEIDGAFCHPLLFSDVHM